MFFVRGLPLSHVQSASEKGSILAGAWAVAAWVAAGSAGIISDFAAGFKPAVPSSEATMTGCVGESGLVEPCPSEGGRVPEALAGASGRISTFAGVAGGVAAAEVTLACAGGAGSWFAATA